jgi:hypothetical protein
MIGLITLEVKQTGERSAGNRPAAFDVAGAGNVTMAAGLRSTAKAVGKPPEPTARAPVLDPTCERLRVKFLGSTRPYIKVQGRWKYLYRAVDKDGDTVDFLLRAKRDKAAARRYFEKAIAGNGALETVTIDKSRANLAGINAINADREVPIKLRQSKYLNNMVEVRPSSDQTHRTSNARIQELPLHPHHFRRYRTHAHDSERADEERRWTASFGPRAVLRSCEISIPIRSVRTFPNFLTATEPA